MAHRPLVGIVLAGGASRRFGSDKLAAPLAGRPLVVHAIEALRRVPVAEIVVVGPPEPATPGWLADVAAAGARLVRDRERFGGPLAGLAEGLRALGSDEIALVVGGDMPWLDPGVLAGLAAALDERDEAGIGCLVTEGRDQLLPLALRPGPALALAAPLLDAGERRLGALRLLFRNGSHYGSVAYARPGPVSRGAIEAPRRVE